MKYLTKSSIQSESNECILAAIFEDRQLSETAEQLNSQLNNEISDLVANGEITGKIGQVQILRKGSERIVLVGCGKPNEINERQYKQIIQKAVQAVKETAAESVINTLTDVKIKDRDLYWNVRFAIETIEESFYVFDQFKSKKNEEPRKLSEVIFNVADTEIAQTELAIQHACAVALGVKAAKDLANCPPNICNPAYLATQAKTLENSTALLKTTILGEAELSELGMQAYLAVSRGSHNEAKLTIMEYRNHPDPQSKPIVLVGKGLTFDAGGISLKPAAEMDEMKYDMCGAASVYGVMNALVSLQLPINVIGVLAGCENLPDGNAYRPGDILTTMNGLTVEVLNTDAEGRLVLCDTLTYVQKFNPELVIDVATLTGACVVALGQHNSGLISTDDELAQQIELASRQSADKAWQLPLSEEYDEQLKSNFADLANIGGRWGGAITAGAFLSHFTKNYRWAHLDIAGTAWLQGANKGATGRPVPLLTQFLINQVSN